MDLNDHERWIRDYGGPTIAPRSKCIYVLWTRCRVYNTLWSTTSGSMLVAHFDREGWGECFLLIFCCCIWLVPLPVFAVEFYRSCNRRNPSTRDSKDVIIISKSVKKVELFRAHSTSEISNSSLGRVRSAAERLRGLDSNQ